jgi:allantoicase
MDGWESRRKRVEGNDWAIIGLGGRCSIEDAIIDTSHFTGNYPPAASLDFSSNDRYEQGSMDWQTLLEKQILNGDQVNDFKLAKNKNATFVRLNIYPDGGVARLRLFGDLIPFYQDLSKDSELSALKNGGKIIGYNNAHYGNVNALLSEGRGTTMGDGWETRRRRVPGHDFIIIELGKSGIISNVELDTCHFKGNFPDRASIQTIDLKNEKDKVKAFESSSEWEFLLGEKKCKADYIHNFGRGDFLNEKTVSHVRLNIYPDGGVSRLRIFGQPVG